MYIYNNAYNESSRLLNSNNIKTDVSPRYNFYLKVFFSILLFLTFLYATHDFFKRDKLLLKFPNLIVKHSPHNDKLPDNELINFDNFINDCPALNESIDNLICPINTYKTKISVKATKNGFWPIGLSWTLLRDEIDLNKDKSYLYSLKNMSMPTPNHSSKICKNYVVELCLYGNYIMFVDTAVDLRDSLYDQEGNDREVSVCNQNVKSGEALELVINEFNCNLDHSTFKPQLEFNHVELSLPSISIASSSIPTSSVPSSSIPTSSVPSSSIPSSSLPSSSLPSSSLPSSSVPSSNYPSSFSPASSIPSSSIPTSSVPSSSIPSSSLPSSSLPSSSLPFSSVPSSSCPSSSPILSPTVIPTAVLDDHDHNDDYVTNQPDESHKKYNDHGKSSRKNSKKHKRYINKNPDDDDDYKNSKRNSENSEPNYPDDKKIESRCEIFGTVLICDNGNNTILL